MKMEKTAHTAEELARIEEELIVGYRYELTGELPRIESYARMALERPSERFQGEKVTARTFLTSDAPRRIRWLSAAIQFLELAPVARRYLFVTGDFEQHDVLVRGLLSDLGFKDREGKWRWIQ